MAIKGELVGKYLTGEDILIEDCNITISQPTVKTILQFGEDNFLAAINFITQVDAMLEDIKKEDANAQFLSSFQLFLTIYNQDIKTRQQLNQFFDMVFPHYKIKITENSIDFSVEENDKFIVKGRMTPFNYESFSKTVEDLFLPYTNKKEEYNPGSDKAKEIAEKLKKGRQKISEQKNDEVGSLFGSYLSILSIGLQMDIYLLLKYTPFQLYDAFMRYNRKRAQDQHFRIKTIPFADTSNMEDPEEWTSNLYS